MSYDEPAIMTAPTEPIRESPSGRFAQIALMSGTLVLTAMLFSPFFSPIVWAVVLSYTLYPLQRKVLHATGGRQELSAFLMCVIMTIGLLLPLLYLTLLVAQDLAGMISSLLTYLREGEGALGEGWRRYPVIPGFVEQMQTLERLTGTDLRSSLVEGLADLGKVLIQYSTKVVKNLLQGIIEFGIVLLASFYFFRDGARIVSWMQEVVPITLERQQMMLRRFDEVVKGAVYGNTVVALLEGIIGGVAFWLVGMPSALLWGAVMAITAYLPLIGAGLVWIPVAIYLGLQGAYVPMWVLVVAGLGIAVIDYLVRNIVVGEASKLHSLIMFFSVIGGIQFFGLVGIIAGPFVVAVAVALLDTYRIEKSLPVLTVAEPGPHEKPVSRGSGAG